MGKRTQQDLDYLYALKARYTLRLETAKWYEFDGWDVKIKENKHGVFIFIPSITYRDLLIRNPLLISEVED